MNLRALEVFVGLMDEGTLTRAAAEMNLSQSAASRLLSLLEDELGASLFERQRRRMVPTRAADALYPEAQRILAQVGALPEIAASGGTSVPLRVLCQTRLMPGLVVPAIAALARAEPSRSVRLETAPRRELARRVLAERHDVAVATLPLPLSGSEAHGGRTLVPDEIGSVPLGVLLPREHELARRASLNVAELSGTPYIALDETTVIRRTVDALLGDGAPEPAHETSSGAAAYRLVAEGLGFAFADVVAVQPELRDRVTLVPWDREARVRIGVIRLGTDADPLVVRFTDTLASVLDHRDDRTLR